MDEDINEGAKAIWIWGLSIVGVMIVGAFLVYGVKPAIERMNTEAARNSQGYVETKQALLIGLLEDYMQLGQEISALTAEGERYQQTIDDKRSQQKAIVSRIRTECSTMKQQDIPLEVRQFLLDHQGEY